MKRFTGVGIFGFIGPAMLLAGCGGGSGGTTTIPVAAAVSTPSVSLATPGATSSIVDLIPAASNDRLVESLGTAAVKLKCNHGAPLAGPCAQSATIPASGGYGGTIALPSGSGTITITSSTSSRANAPALGAAPRLYVTVTAQTAVTLNGIPGFAFFVPAPLRGQLRIARQSGGWAQIAGPVTIVNSKATFAPAPGLIKLAVRQTASFALYGGVVTPSPTRSASPSPLPSATPTTIPTAAPSATPTAAPKSVTAVVTTLAGDGTWGGYQDGPGATAKFKELRGLAVDSIGNVYAADSENERIRKITPAGVVSSLAGNGTSGYQDGTGSSAIFELDVSGVAVDSHNNVFVADQGNSRIRKVTSAGVVTTFAGSSTKGALNGTGTAAQFCFPYGVAIDSAANLYVADTNNNLIRKITPAGVVTTLAGGTQGYSEGTGSAAQFNDPMGVAVDATGNVYVADSGNSRIRKITAAGVVTTFAGSGAAGYQNGTGTAAQFNFPQALAVDAAGNVYVADSPNAVIRKITSAGVVTTFAGSTQGYLDGTGSSAQFTYPTGIAIDLAGNVYVADSGRIRKITTTLSTGPQSKVRKPVQ